MSLRSSKNTFPHHHQQQHQQQQPGPLLDLTAIAAGKKGTFSKKKSVGGKRGVIIIARTGEEEKKKNSLTGRYLNFADPAPKENIVFNKKLFAQKAKQRIFKKLLCQALDILFVRYFLRKPCHYLINWSKRRNATKTTKNHRKLF